MNQAQTQFIIREFGRHWDVVPLADLRIEVDRTFFRAVAHRVYHESEDWTGFAYLERNQQQPAVFDFRPQTEALRMPPPWAAYPTEAALSINWRMGRGEKYMGDWRVWYDSLSAAGQAEYRGRFPAPRDERDWCRWFYDFCDAGDDHVDL